MPVLKYVYLFILLVAFAFALPCLFTAFSIHRKSGRSGTMTCFLGFYICFIIKMLVFSLQACSMVLTGVHSVFSDIILEFFNFIVSSFFFLFIALFIHELFKVPYRKKARIFIYILCIIFLVNMFMPWSARIDRTGINLKLGTGFYISEFVFYSGILYTLISGFIYRKNLIDGRVRKMIVFFEILTAVFLPLFIIEELNGMFFDIPFVFQDFSETSFVYPVYYQLFNFILLYQVLKNRLLFSLELSDSEISERFTGSYSISNREKEIIELVARGLSNKEIADRLFISYQTVKNHIYSIFQKTGAANRVELLNKLITEL